MKAVFGTMRAELVGAGGVVERNAYLTKRYIWWDLAWFIWTVANTLTIVFIAKGVEASGAVFNVNLDGNGIIYSTATGVVSGSFTASGSSALLILNTAVTTAGEWVEWDDIGVTLADIKAGDGSVAGTSAAAAVGGRNDTWDHSA